MTHTNRAIAAIEAARQRQITRLSLDDYTVDQYDRFQLASAAAGYAWVAALPPHRRARYDDIDCKVPPKFWKLHHGFWQPDTRITDLAEAGAYCVAEMTRLYRLGGK